MLSNVSVCIPTYNQGQFLLKTIRSVVAQTMRPFEIIVSNDCSQDDTKEVLEGLKKEIPSLKVFHQPVNLGISRNVDFCLREAQGDFVVRVDSDDLLMPEFVKRLVEQLQLFPQAGYAHAAVQEINQKGEPSQIRKLFRNAGYQSGDEALRKALTGYRVAANIIMFRRTALQKVNYNCCSANFAEDYYMTTAISASGFGNIYLNEVLSFYRVWVDSEQVRSRRKLSELYGLLSVTEEVIEPAFMKRGWSLQPVERRRSAMAVDHSDCLSWPNYTKEEKKELIQAIFKMSSSKKVGFFVWCYMNKCGGYIDSYKKSIQYSKRVLKRTFN